jgi:hypothetical protein
MCGKTSNGKNVPERMSLDEKWQLEEKSTYFMTIFGKNVLGKYVAGKTSSSLGKASSSTEKRSYAFGKRHKLASCQALRLFTIFSKTVLATRCLNILICRGVSLLLPQTVGEVKLHFDLSC